jgi:hypothetical protein
LIRDEQDVAEASQQRQVNSSAEVKISLKIAEKTVVLSGKRTIKAQLFFPCLSSFFNM